MHTIIINHPLRVELRIRFDWATIVGNLITKPLPSLLALHGHAWLALGMMSGLVQCAANYNLTLVNLTRS